MEWLNLLGHAARAAGRVIRDVVFTGFGLWVIYRQVLAASPNIGLIFTGLALASPAAAERLRRMLASGNGSSPSPLPPPSPGPSPASSSGQRTDG